VIPTGIRRRCNQASAPCFEKDRKPSPQSPLLRTTGEGGAEGSPLAGQNRSSPPHLCKSLGLLSSHGARRYLPGRVYRRRAYPTMPVPEQCPPSPATLNETPTEASTPETIQTAPSTEADSMDDAPNGSGLEEAPGLVDAAAGLEPEGIPPSLSASFINNFTRPAAQPLLHQHQQAPSNPKKRGRHGVRPVRRSKRLAAVVWPRGNIQERARQVLMKRLGILPSIGQPTAAANGEAALEHYINLFKGPLTTVALQALLPLCGIIPQGQTVQGS
jgi:hypothetical protein